MPQTFQAFGWRYNNPERRYIVIPLRPYFDGLLFVKHARATTPTANSAAASREGRGF